MARLHTEAVARWASGAAFPTVPMLLAVSISDEAGSGVRGVPASAFHVRYQVDPDNAFTAALSDFHEHGGALGVVGNYSLIVKPNEEISPQIWVQDEVFLYVMVRHAGNHGQTLCMARFHSTA
jgi:hypothetical protein